MSIIPSTKVMSHSVIGIEVNLRQTARYTVGRRTMVVPREKDSKERLADEIGARPPYAYTSACKDGRYRR